MPLIGVSCAYVFATYVSNKLCYNNIDVANGIKESHEKKVDNNAAYNKIGWRRYEEYTSFPTLEHDH